MCDPADRKVENGLMLFTGNPEAWGYIPEFLNEDDPRPAQEQIHSNYAHGGGWHDFEGFTLDFDREKLSRATLSYPGDPSYHLRGWTLLRDELILLFPHSWVVIVQPDDTWRCARLD